MLTKKDKEIIKLLLAGKSNKEIAKELYVSVHTVKSYLEKLYRNYDVHNRIQFAIKIISEKLISLDYLP